MKKYIQISVLKNIDIGIHRSNHLRILISKRKLIRIFKLIDDLASFMRGR
jgi:hypothetical protein